MLDLPPYKIDKTGTITHNPATMRILKFGGSSLGSAERIKKVASIIETASIEPVTVIASAMSGSTDQLLKMAHVAAKGNNSYQAMLEELKTEHLGVARELLDSDNLDQALTHIDRHFNELQSLYHGVSLLREATPRVQDLILSFGERMSAFLLTQVLIARQQYPKTRKVEYLDARAIIKTDSNFGGANVIGPVTYDNIRKYCANPEAINVVTGFIASTEKGETTTLGRGGSDYTAALVGAALGAEEIQLWTDVSGVLTADPRKVKKALAVKELSYEEALELSHFGAKVIHPPSLKPAIDQGIPIRILNTFDPSVSGTYISKSKPITDHPITGISSVSQISLLHVKGSGLIGVAGIAKRIFSCLSENRVNVILISQASSEHSICVAIDPSQALTAKSAVAKEFSLEIDAGLIDSVSVREDLSIIAVVGENMAKSPGLAGKLFESLGYNGINVVAIAQGSTELNISVVIEAKDETKALNAVHDAFFLSERKTLNLFIVGLGQVGRTLFEQLAAEKRSLDKRQLDIQLVGLANSKYMALAKDNIDFDNWETPLKQTGDKSNIEEFVQGMINLNLPNSIFVDCTASEDVARQYEKILRSAISIVTPNKKANSGSFDSYVRLKNTARKSNSRFFYETNVGAGLPIIGTLNDLLISGDNIIRIEAVLSGTLSYIFNSFTAGTTFSEIVKDARNKGFTEPDPRDDLSGTDVARKLLILAREMGLNMELKDISVESLIPEVTANAKNPEEFLELLPEADSYFEGKQRTAINSGKRLRYLGSIEDGKASVSLQAVDNQHPFYDLSGSDNIISFTTTRYLERPLVVKGPGAGTEVTAAGVFADIIRVAN